MAKINFDRFESGKPGTIGNNTTFTIDPATGTRSVYLHGNEIINYHPETGLLSFTLAGWNSVTTRDRINSFLKQYGPRVRVPDFDNRGYYLISEYQVCQRNHEPYLQRRDEFNERTHTLLDPDDWIEVI